jgi:hypothetical protein
MRLTSISPPLGLPSVRATTLCIVRYRSSSHLAEQSQPIKNVIMAFHYILQLYKPETKEHIFRKPAQKRSTQPFSTRLSYEVSLLFYESENIMVGDGTGRPKQVFFFLSVLPAVSEHLQKASQSHWVRLRSTRSFQITHTKPASILSHLFTASKRLAPHVLKG